MKNQDIKERILELTVRQLHGLSAKNYEIYGFYIGCIEDEEDRIKLMCFNNKCLKNISKLEIRTSKCLTLFQVKIGELNN